MNKGELIAAMADRSGVNQGQAGDCLDAFFDIVCQQVSQGGEVSVTGYIKFTQVDRAARMGRNPADRRGPPCARIQGRQDHCGLQAQEGRQDRHDLVLRSDSTTERRQAWLRRRVGP